MGEGDRSTVVTACKWGQTAFGVAAGCAFLVSFGLAGSDYFELAILIAVALGGGTLLCGGVAALREPEELVGNTFPAESGMLGNPSRIRTLSGGLLFAGLYTTIGALLFLVGSVGALSVL